MYAARFSVVIRLIFTLSVSLVPARALLADSHYVIMGTGDITGVYFPAGGAICQLLNAERERHHIRCAVESTQGSAYNLNALQRNELDLAIVQPDWHYHSSVGSELFRSRGADQDLRTLLQLHNEQITLVARADSGIRSFNDLKGKRVNLGSPDSGQRRTLDLILQSLGWDYSSFGVASELAATEASNALCSGRIDAFVYIVGHPNSSVSEATRLCDSRLIPLPDSLIAQFAERYPFYQTGAIPGGLYPNNPKPVKTLQLTASLVAHKQLDEAVVTELVKAVYQQFEYFRTLHPALESLSRQDVFQSPEVISEYHPAVLRYLEGVNKTLPELQ